MTEEQSLYLKTRGYSGESAEYLAFFADKYMEAGETMEQAIDRQIEERHGVTPYGGGGFSWTLPVGNGSIDHRTPDQRMTDLIRSAWGGRYKGGF